MDMYVEVGTKFRRESCLVCGAGISAIYYTLSWRERQAALSLSVLQTHSSTHCLSLRAVTNPQNKEL